MYDLFVDGMSYVAKSTSSSVSLGSSGVSRDVLWERALSALPPVLRSALRAAELDDPRVLSEYPVESLRDLEDSVGGKLETGGVPSGATSSGQPSSSSCKSSTAILSESSGTSPGGLVGSVLEVGSTMGTDPRTGIAPFVPSGGEVKTDHTGGDPRTDLHVPSGGEVKTDQLVPSGGEVKTDHAPYDVQMAGVSDKTVDSPLLGRLATQTATPDPVSPALPDFAVSRDFDHEVSDGFPSMTQDPGFRDGLPRSEQDRRVRDEFPRIDDFQGQAHFEGLNSTSDCETTVFSRVFHVAEKSERLRESDSGVQIVPASRSPSELSAHQMGLPLAGTVRLKSEPVSIDPMSTLAIGDLTQLSISDRALLRKYKSSGQAQELPRQAETYNDNTAAVRRVDGHSPELRISLYDRILLRKYSIPGTSVSPVVPLPIESTKKRRRFHQKGKLIEEATKEVSGHENCQDQEGSPCGFSSQVAEPPVRAATIISHSVPSPVLSHFTLLYYTLVRDGALPLGYLQEFLSLEAPARRSANRLQASAVAVSDSAES